MNPDSSSPLFMELVQEFNLQTHGDAGERVAGSLNRGLALLRDALFARLHYDFEKIVGKDSMLMPLSVLRKVGEWCPPYAFFQALSATETKQCDGDSRRSSFFQ